MNDVQIAEKLDLTQGHVHYCRRCFSDPEYRKKINGENKSKWANDPQYRITKLLRHRLSEALKLQRVVKNNSAIELLGCSLKKFKEYLGNQFEPGMSWENYGADGWHIDHIKPCISFDLRLLSQREECFHYLNMRPMWAAENVKKSSIYKGKNYRRSCINT